MYCLDKNCLLSHIKNPSTGMCVDKHSTLGSLILKNKREEQISNSPIESHLNNTVNLQKDNKIKNKNLDIKQYSIQEEKLEKKEGKSTTIEKIELDDDWKNTIIQDVKNLKKQNDELFILIENIEKNENIYLDMKEEIHNLKNEIINIKEFVFEKENKKHQTKSLDLINLQNEKMKCIQILKNEFHIVAHAEPDHKDNIIIKKVLKIVEKNVQDGFLTTINKELLLNLQ